MNVEMRFFNGPEDWPWFTQYNPIKRCEDTGGIVAWNPETGERLAACITDNWRPNSVQCHTVIRNRMVLRRGFLEHCFNFMFNVGKVSKIYAFVPGTNRRAVKLNKKLGFTVKTTLDDAFAVGIDLLLMELTRENCRFIEAETA
jgi:RimJ/RimL family protein N-acetyltransferase